MITYKDMTWCSRECGNLDCFRNYTPDERDRNERTVNLPIAQADFRDDDCGWTSPFFHRAETMECPSCKEITLEHIDTSGKCRHYACACGEELYFRA